MEHRNVSHFNPFVKNVKIVDLTRSITWTEYTYHLRRVDFIKFLLLFLILPISLPAYHVLNYFHLINGTYGEEFYTFYSYILEKSSSLSSFLLSLFLSKKKPEPNSYLYGSLYQICLLPTRL